MSTTPNHTTPARATSPSATQRMFFELSETKPVELPPHLRYKSPLRTNNSVFQGASGRYMESKKPPPPAPENLGHPDFESIHGRANHAHADTPSRYTAEPKEKPESSFVPLDKTVGVRYDPEVEKMKEYSAKVGFAGATAKFMDDAQLRGHFEQGESPRELAEITRRKRLGIHPRTFRPVSEVCAKTFDEYASVAKVWKTKNGLETEPKEIKKMKRPSVVMEYVRSNTPILTRKGASLTPTGKEKERVEELRRRPPQEFHFLPSPHAGNFSDGPLGEHPKGFKKGVKECYNRERELIKKLAERLSGSAAKYSPARMLAMSTPLRARSPVAGSAQLQQPHEQQQQQASSMQRSTGSGNSEQQEQQQQQRQEQEEAERRAARLNYALEDPVAMMVMRRGPQRNKTPLRAVTPPAAPLGGDGPQRPRQWR